jgi:aspartate kinase
MVMVMVIQVSVDAIASSEVSLSITLDKKQREKHDIPKMLSKLSDFADASVYNDRAIISLICNVDRAAEVLLCSALLCTALLLFCF